MVSVSKSHPATIKNDFKPLFLQSNVATVQGVVSN